MPVAAPPFSELDPAAVAAALAEIVARVEEDNATLDLRPGVLYSILGYYEALLATQRRAEIGRYLAARSLLALEADPATADPDLVDDVLSNYLLAREGGTNATGDVVIVLASDTTVTIGVGATFLANGLRFAAAQTYAAKVEADQINGPGDRLLSATSDGRFAFTVTVTATVIGAASRLAKDTTIVPESVPPGYVTSYAASDFGGGTDAETNADLLARLRQGVAAKCLASRGTSAALVRSFPETALFGALSIVGMGDAEMLRDKHALFPAALGGRVDWYLRTRPAVYRLALTRTATLVSVDALGRGTWQLTIGRDDLPGFYEAAAIRVAGIDPASITAGFAVTGDVRGLDLSGPGFVPDVADAVEGAYSRFQTAVIRFLDTATPAAGLAPGATAAYDLELRGQPAIGALQDHVSSPDVRHRGMDCLVKAPVPCFVRVGLTVFVQSGQGAPDVAGIAHALAAAVASVGFLGRLYAAGLSAAVSGFLTPPMSLSGLDMLGRIRRPDGATVWLRDPVVLVVPDDPEGMISARTVQFFLAPEDVTVAVEVGIALPD